MVIRSEAHLCRENHLSYSGFVGSRKVLLKSILLHPFVVPAETPQSISIVLECRKCSFIAHSDPALHLDLLGIVPVLIAVSMTVFFPVCPSLVAIRFSASVQLVSSNLFLTMTVTVRRK
jgi:hypothetical protein